MIFFHIDLNSDLNSRILMILKSILLKIKTRNLSKLLVTERIIRKNNVDTL
jgi:hypothetical protein